MKGLLAGLLSLFVLAVASHAAVTHRWVCVDNGWNRLIYVDETGSTEDWWVSIPEGSRDIQLLEGDRLLISHGSGAAEYALASGELLGWVADSYEKIQTARRLANAHTLLGSIDGVLYEVDASGSEVSRTRIAAESVDMRVMRFTPEDTLLIGGIFDQRKVIAEVRRTGEIIKTWLLSDKGYKAVRLPNGNILAGTGDSVTVIEMDPTGKIVSSVGGKDAHPSLGLDFCSGWDLLPNGNILMTNWQGHLKESSAPHLVEFSPDNRVVWTWNDHVLARQVTNVLCLDYTTAGEP